MIRGRAIRNERGNSQHPKRSTYTKNRWERLSLRYIRRLRTRNGWLAISRVSKHARVWCARDIYWVYGHYRGLLSPWQRHVTYGTGRLISIPRGEITIVPFLFGSRLRSPETVGRVLVGRMVITYCQAVALVRPRLMGHSSLFAGCIHINAPRLTEFEAILRRIFFSSSLSLSLSLSLVPKSIGLAIK